MNIALVTETYPPEINGVAMTLSQLVASLRDRGHQVQVSRPIQKDEEPSQRSNNTLVKLQGFPIPNYPEMRFGLPSFTRLIREWRKFKPDIVHVATEGPLGVSAINAARRIGIPVVSTFHTNFHSYSKHYGIAALTPVILAYLRWVHNRTACSMAPTIELANELHTHGFHNMQVFGRGVQLDTFNPSKRDPKLRASWGAKENDPIIIHVSRLAAEKNYELLFETYREILSTHPNAKFIIVGSGPLESKLKAEFPQAIFTGPISLEDRPELARHYASADIFLYPSETETYGNVLTEAMACGNAVVAYDYAAAAQHIKHSHNGFAISLGDPQAFKKASLELVANKELQQRLANNAVTTARNFEWNTIIDKVESIYTQHTNKHNH